MRVVGRIVKIGMRCPYRVGLGHEKTLMRKVEADWIPNDYRKVDLSAIM